MGTQTGMPGAAHQGSTLPSDDSGVNHREQVLRVVSVVLIAGLVMAGAVGLLGVRTGSAEGSGDGYEVEVIHALVTRPGLATPLSVLVRTTDDSPLPERVTTRIDAGYLDMFDENGLEPSPSKSFQDGKWTWWTFEIPGGQSEFQWSLDARLEPAVQWGRNGSVALMNGDVELVRVVFRTWVIP